MKKRPHQHHHHNYHSFVSDILLITLACERVCFVNEHCVEDTIKSNRNSMKSGGNFRIFLDMVITHLNVEMDVSKEKQNIIIIIGCRFIK